MKAVTGTLLAFLIALSLAGCGQTSPPQDFDASAAAGDVTPAAGTVSATFDIDGVNMQSTPESTCFSEVGYDRDFEVLVVRFRDSGSVYTYSDFPASEWDAFIAADSLGSWYNANIKGAYECERIS
ncbi:MAG TPA: lipoprotein [Terriglobales bacterium]|nr:lipoprotein [Terriglobales bacterium]